MTKSFCVPAIALPINIYVESKKKEQFYRMLHKHENERETEKKQIVELVLILCDMLMLYYIMDDPCRFSVAQRYLFSVTWTWWCEVVNWVKCTKFPLMTFYGISISFTLCKWERKRRKKIVSELKLTASTADNLTDEWWRQNSNNHSICICNYYNNCTSSITQTIFK